MISVHKCSVNYILELFCSLFFRSYVVFFRKEVIYVTVGENIRQIRLSKNLTQKQLGELCKPQMADSAIRRYESGRANPKIETVKKIADALKVPFEYLMYGNQEDIGENIRYYRDEKDFTLEELSLKTSIPIEKLATYENNIKRPTDREIRNIEKSLSLFPGDLTVIQGMKYEGTPDGMKLVKKSPDELRQSLLLHHYEKLNDKGKDVAINQVEALAEVPDFQRKEE